MDLLDSVVKLDNEEENRKADYSIWGFLYQFDLTLLDILKNNTENDIFEDGKKDADTIYQIEVVEDYIKTYTINDKDYIRLAQVKYTSTSNSFSKWEVIVDLYYNYLKIKNDCNAEIDYKCYILFNAESEIKIERNEILENGRKQIGNFLKAIELSVDEDIEEKNVLAKKIKENRKKNNQLTRQVKCIEEFYSKDELEDFLDNKIDIKWCKNLKDTEIEIKNILYEKFGNLLKEYSEDMKKDILYSLAINYIYDKWSNKDKKNEIVYIKPEELFDYINTAIVNENFAYNYIIKIIMEIEGEIEEEIRDEFIDEGKESQIDDIITKEYKDKFIECLDFFKSTLNNKLNRFKLINTLSLVEVKTYDKYDLLSTTEEIQELAQIKELLFVYIKRLLKFNKYYNIELEKCLDFNNDIILFNIPDEMRSCVLFSNSKRSTRTSHKNLLKRLYKAKLKPKVWYFDKIDLPNRLYNSSIMKPSLNKEVVITNPEKNDYFIECMDCLQEDSYTKCDKIFCIFKEECISNGERKDN